MAIFTHFVSDLKLIVSVFKIAYTMLINRVKEKWKLACSCK